MGRRLAQGSDERFAAYVEEIASVIGHADWVGPVEAYCIGLLLPSQRKSVEPMVAVTAPKRDSAQHQSLLHVISHGGWSDGKVLGKVREMGSASYSSPKQRGKPLAPQCGRTPPELDHARQSPATHQDAATP